MVGEFDDYRILSGALAIYAFADTRVGGWYGGQVVCGTNLGFCVVWCRLVLADDVESAKKHGGCCRAPDRSDRPDWNGACAVV